MKLRRRAPGSWFGLVLRAPQFSHGAIALGGALGGKSTVPVPDLGSSCVCCGRANSPTRPFDASTDRLTVDPIAIPVCETCAPHLPKSTRLAQGLGGLLCVGAGLAACSVRTTNPRLADELLERNRERVYRATIPG